VQQLELIMTSKPKNPFQIPGKQIKFLVVDDSKSMRAMLRVALHEYNPAIEIIEAIDGPSGLQELRLHTFDAIFLDIALPGIHGLEVLSRLRKTWADVPVIMCTGNNDTKTVIMALGKGANGYIVKPVNQVKVHKALNAVVDDQICPLCGNCQQPIGPEDAELL
jgi:DNA-binding response OmpR family regulator